MGTHPVLPSVQYRQAFQNMFVLNYTLFGSKLHPTLGTISIYKDRHSKSIDIFVKYIQVPHTSVYPLYDLLYARIGTVPPGLLQIYDVRRRQYEGLCGKSDYLCIWCEYRELTLRKYLSRRLRPKVQDLSKIVYRMAYSFFNSLAYLHNIKEFYGYVSTVNVFICYRGVRLIDRPMIMDRIMDLDVLKEDVAVLKGRGILFSPSIMRCLYNRKTQIHAYDPFKADVFSIGMLLLEVATLYDSMDIYDYQYFSINQNEIIRRLNKVCLKYSRKLAYILAMTLVEDDYQRRTAQEIASIIKASQPTMIEYTIDANLITYSSKISQSATDSRLTSAIR